MPTSNLAMAPTVLGMASKGAHATVLDVGPGHGKYAILCREYLGSVLVHGIEAWHPYVQQFNLSCLYDDLFLGDVQEMDREFFDRYDLILMVDVLEHIDHPHGELLLREMRGANVVICTPTTFFQNPEADTIPPERHRSLWTADELRAVRPVDALEEFLGGVVCHMPPY